MDRIIDIVAWFFSFLWKVLGCDSFKVTSPDPSQGGELAPLRIHNLKPAKGMLPLLGRGSGGGLFCLFLLANCLLATAQSFPVRIVPQVLSPAPIYFADYADEGSLNGPLRVQLILNDLGIADREIRLKVFFEGNDIVFQGNDIVSGAGPLYLEGGIPLVLTNVELAPYFKFGNITGVSPQVYGGPIPEGSYKFCFEVYDVLTGNRLSQRSCATTVIFQNEPPFLVLPANKSNIRQTDPQNIVFQWTPRSINVSNVEYELSIVEIWDNMVDPQQAFLSSPPIFRTTTNATAYLYGPADPLLLSGKNYAWRVRVKAKKGTEEIGLFKNQGNSEIFSFGYARACDLPTGLAHEVKGSTNANIFWDDFSTDVPEYTVRYRKSSSASDTPSDPSWFISSTTANQLTLWDLMAGTTYEYQLRKKCTVIGSDWSASNQFTTFIADNATSVYECGISPNITLDNKEPLPRITAGESFTAGDFPIKIGEVKGSDGRFTGEGYVTIPYLNSIKVAVEFTNVLINTDRQLVEGTVVTKYDQESKNILDIDTTIDQIVDTYDAVADLGDTTENILRDIFGEEPDDIEDNEVEDEGPASNYEGGTAAIDQQEETTNLKQDNSVPSIAENNGNADIGPAPSNTGNIQAEPSKATESSSNPKEVFIVYNGKDYRNGDMVEVPFHTDLEKQLFQCANVPDDSKISWNAHTNIDDVTALSWVGDGPAIDLDIKDYVTRTLEVQYWSPASSYPDGEPKKVRVGIRVLRKEFELVELYAKHGARRIAISGKKLYLIEDKDLTDSSEDKEVTYNVELNPRMDERDIKDLSLSWYYGTNEAVPQNSTKLRIFRKLSLQDTPDKTTVNAGFPILSEKAIEVVWVDGSQSEYSFVPQAVSEVLTKSFDQVEDNVELLDKYIPIAGFEFKIKPVKITGEKYNKEDDKSRLYKKYEVGSISGGLEFKPPELKFTHPALEVLSRMHVANIGLYAQLGFSFEVVGGVERYKYVEHTNYENDNPFLKVIGKGCIDVGAKAELLVARDQLEFLVDFKGTGCISGSGKYAFGEEKLTLGFYLEPVILSGKIHIETKGALNFELMDWSRNLGITPKQELCQKEIMF